MDPRKRIPYGTGGDTLGSLGLLDQPQREPSHLNAIAGLLDHYTMGLPSALAGLNPLGGGYAAAREAADRGKSDARQLYGGDALSLADAFGGMVPSRIPTAGSDAQGIARALQAGGSKIDDALSAGVRMMPEGVGSMGGVPPKPQGIRAYHGTTNGGFDQFDPKKVGSSQMSDDATRAPAWFFDTSPEGSTPYSSTPPTYPKRTDVVGVPGIDYYQFGDGAATIPVTLAPKNVFVSKHRTEPYPAGQAEIMKQAFANGHDAVRFEIAKGINDQPQTIYAVRPDAQGVVYGAHSGADMIPAQGIRAYHGSPHDFDRFDMSKIGTGEGAQAYGHGLYFAENEGVAQSYRDKLVDGASFIRPDGTHWDPGSLRHMNVRVTARRDGIEAAIAKARELSVPPYSPTTVLAGRDLAALEKLQADGGVKPNPGRMYEVNIKADPADFLDWDKPLSQQSEKVKDRYLAALGSLGNPSPEKILESSFSSNGDGMETLLQAWSKYDRQKATQALRDQGVPGIRYLDQGSRAGGKGSSNYVVFDDRLIEILRKYGLLPLGLGAGLMGNKDQGSAAP